MHVRRECVGERLALARRDLHSIPLRRQVPKQDRRVRGTRHIDGSREGAADDEDGDGSGFVVCDIEDGAGRTAVDEFDAEDLGVGEGGADVDGDIGGGAYGGFVVD